MQDVIYVDEGIEEVTEVYPTQVLPRTGSSVGRASTPATPKHCPSTSIVVPESCPVVPASPKSLSRASSLSNWASPAATNHSRRATSTFYAAIVLVIKYSRLSCLCCYWAVVKCKNHVRVLGMLYQCNLYEWLFVSQFCTVLCRCQILLAIRDGVVVIRHGNVQANVFQLECMITAWKVKTWWPDIMSWC
jgi:hypothetical protein